jgi:hypothetical protein
MDPARLVGVGQCFEKNAMAMVKSCGCGRRRRSFAAAAAKRQDFEMEFAKVFAFYR